MHLPVKHVQSDEVHAAVQSQVSASPPSSLAAVRGFQSSSSVPLQLWHHRLGHPNATKINLLLSQGLISSCNKEPLAPVCSSCQSAVYSYRFKIIINVLVLVLSWLGINSFGFMGTIKCAISLWISILCLLVDDYTRYTWIFFLKKSDGYPCKIFLFLGGPFWEKDSVSSIRGIYVSKIPFILS